MNIDFKKTHLRKGVLTAACHAEFGMIRFWIGDARNVSLRPLTEESTSMQSLSQEILQSAVKRGLLQDDVSAVKRGLLQDVGL